MRLTFGTLTRSVTVMFLVLFATSLFGAMHVLAADGSGTANVSPSTIDAGATGNDIEVDFFADGDMADGGVRFTLPAEWENPQTTPGVAGYVSVMTTGLTGETEDSLDSATGFADNSLLITTSTDTTTVKEGSGSVKVDVALGLGQGRVYKNYSSSQDWSGYTHAAFWLRSSSVLSLGDLNFAISTNTGINGGTTTTFAVPAMAANTWTHVVIDLGSASRSSIRSFGLQVPLALLASYNIDNFMLGPTDSWTIAGDVITVPMMSLPDNEIVALIYGGTGGASGFTASTVAGPDEVAVASKIDVAGTYTQIASSPIVTTLPGEVTTVEIEALPEYLTLNKVIATPIEVALYDAFGNLATNDDTTTVNLGTSTRPGHSDVLGTVEKSATNGVAIFDDILVNRVGDYVFKAHVTFLITDEAEEAVTAYGVVVSEEPCNVSEELGSPCEFLLQLSHEPTHNVTVEISGITGDIELAETEFVFTSENWYEGQWVYVMAINDNLVESEEYAQLMYTATSSDDHYDEGTTYFLTPVTVTSDDYYGIVLTESDDWTMATEGDTSSDTFFVSLRTQPTEDVVINLDHDEGQLTLSESELTFTSEDWDEPQEVIVEAYDDEVPESQFEAYIDLIFDSLDSNYHELIVDQIVVNVSDNDGE
jgi:hypothetical protein